MLLETSPLLIRQFSSAPEISSSVYVKCYVFALKTHRKQQIWIFSGHIVSQFQWDTMWLLFGSSHHQTKMPHFLLCFFTPVLGELRPRHQAAGGRMRPSEPNQGGTRALRPPASATDPESLPGPQLSQLEG